MIRIDLDEDTLRTVRLTLSPLWETFGSLGVLARYRGEVPAPYTEWARAVRRTLPTGLADDLAGVLRDAGLSRLAPEFVSLPDPARDTFAAELDHLRRMRGDRAEERHLFVLLSRYWDCALAPHWHRIRSSLEEEILLRGRTLAVEGVEAMLGELGGRVLWSRPRLTVPYHRDLDLSIARSRLLLVPTVFAGGLRLLVEEPEGVAMSYQARATGRLRVLTAGADGDRTEDRLALLLGRGRAQVVRALELPMTTTDVAEALGLAKSTVSQHLAILSGSGVVWKRRIGASVFYQLDQSGLALLRQLG
ncbi:MULTISPECIES: helix-turn-helix transcriptional regulator [unclassified Streptomyces]|uniref:ArsR/SmtB family transcription factor n=1 Tax=Streptomyces TaxID=1883 RepID=UPI0015C4DA53|nr:helix-turn-helix domain-containing protein [Streptomyces sp. CB04723]QLG31885.1 helix-turn-helix transcriptional regulator [Streptomyces sp. CB04723]